MLNDSDLIKIDDMKEFDSDDLETLLHKILNYIKHITGADAGTIYLKDRNYLKFHIFQNDTFDYETIYKLQKPLKDLKFKLEEDSDTIAVESFLQNKIITVDDIYHTSTYDFKSAKEFDKKFNYKTKSILTAPLVNFYTHETIGVLQLINKQENEELVVFTKEDKEFISLTSYLIALSIINAQESIEKLKLVNLELEDKVLARTQELEDIQQKLMQQANRDPLTNLYNRRYFNEISKNLISIAKREQQDLSILIMDIDDFKNINDTYGHSVGDSVILYVADVLVATARKSDICVRFGGEEFVVVLPNTSFEASQILAEKIRKKIDDAKLELAHNTITFTLSIGISQVSSNDVIIESALKKADEALYEAKKAGKNQTRFNI
jgi:diguanylate cyclase (GGDEF)-like protein